ncbi:MAG: hypothetical protein JNK48_20400 [Bryobacterales bacterium]|nr:hypothetical protein [Bryobacterales bacterium]
MLPQLLLLFAECITVQEIRYGELEVVPIDHLGQRLETAELEVHENGRPIVRAVQGQELPKLRYGTYRIRVRAKGFADSWLDVTLAQPRTFVRAHQEVGFECGPLRAELKGIITSSATRRDLWIKAIPLRGSGGYETRAGPNGRFLFAGLPITEYVVLVLKDGEVVHQQILRPERPVTIELD